MWHKSIDIFNNSNSGINEPHFKISDFSLFRSEMMGLAILWVMAFHLVSKGKDFFDFGFLNPILGIGYGGVDIFLFLSGLGLYYSYTKQPNSILFYKKRLIRIFPTYIIICIAYEFLCGYGNCLLNITTIGYWIGESHYDWYVPAILAFYILFPYLYKLTTKVSPQSLSICSLVIITIIIVAIHYFTNMKIDDDRMFFISRIPIFIVGTSFGHILRSNQKIKNIDTLLIILAIGGLLMLFCVKNQHYISFGLASGVSQYPFVFITPGLLLGAGVFLHFTERYWVWINKSLKMVGGLSLELYLVHLHLFACCPYYEHFNVYLYVLILFAVSFILAFLLHAIVIKSNMFIRNIFLNVKK